MDLSLLLAAVGLFVYLAAFAYYISLVIRGGVNPNASTWLIWAVLGIVNAMTYQSLSGDWVKSVMAYGTAFTNGLTFIIAMRLGRFGRLGKMDKVLAAFGLLAVVAWLVNKHTPYANMLVMGCIIISTVPTLRSTWEKPNRESPIAWLMLGISYLFPLVVVLMRWEQIWDLMFPAVGFVANSSVGLLCLRRSDSSTVETR